MEDKSVLKLTSTEISALWTSYMSNTLSKCMLSYFLAKVEDNEIKSVLELLNEMAENHIEKIEDIMESQQFSIPDGFSEKDVDTKAPRLFMDTFFLNYVKQMTAVGISGVSLVIPTMTHPYTKNFYNEVMSDLLKLNNEIDSILLNKGLYVKSPYLIPPKRVEYVESNKFLGNLLGKNRPIIAQEITHIYANIQINALGKALCMAFSQVAKSEKVRKLMVDGKKLANKHLLELTKFLQNSDLTVPMTWDDQVTSSTISPFSDKLILFHLQSLTGAAISDYGASFGTSLRKDINATYVKMMTHTSDYSLNLIELMIENNWFEQPPTSVDRNQVAKKGNRE